MKILWVTSNFLHPTTKGGQIRTLEMLRLLHRRHEVHFFAIENPAEPEGPARASEYSSKAYPYRAGVPARNSPGFYWQVAQGLISSVPVAVGRHSQPGMKRFLEGLMQREQFDRTVCDFLAPAEHFPDIEHGLLFQHNVETTIWRRHVEHAGNPVTRAYLKLQADRMFRYERNVCRRAGYIAAVSEADACAMKQMFGVDRVAAIPTGVDIDYFAPPPQTETKADLVFVGSMDWSPNVDGVQYFVREILPLIRSRCPGCRVAIVGRRPPAPVTEMAERDPQLIVTGTVPDVRPWLWGSAVSIVPLRIGGGTRLKIYEAMAAQTAVVSTTVGAEGLDVTDGADIRLADTPQAFADCCVDLLNGPAERGRLRSAAHELVRTHCSWDRVVRDFERVLDLTPAAAAA